MNNFSFAQRSIVAACAAACAGLSLAQPTPELQPIVVTASRGPQQLTDTLPHTTVLQRTDIERSQAADIIGLLQREAGVQFTQNGGRGTSSSIFLRGSASLQTLVLLDGIPLTRQDATGSLGLEHVALDQIERIEIVRGNVSAIYGSGAIGGVVQMFSRRGQGVASASLVVELGSSQSRKMSVSAQGAFGTDSATRVFAGSTIDRTDGFSAINTAQMSLANPDRDDFKNRSESFTIAHDLHKDHTLGLMLQRSDGHFGFDNPFGAPGDLQRGHNRQQSTTAHSINRFTPNWLSRLSLSERIDRSVDTDNGEFGYTSIAKTRVRQWLWSNTLALGSETSATVGLEQQRQSINTDDGLAAYLRSRNVDALFAGVQSQFGSHQVQLNLRRDKVQGMGAEITAYLGYGYALSPAWKITASRSTAFNVAPLGYLFAPSFGNPHLKPEKAKSAELGIQWSGVDQVLRASLFDTRSRDLFEFDFNSNRFANVARTKNFGLEVSYNGKINSWDVRASLTSQNPKDLMTGKLLNRRARALGALSLDRDIGKWRMGADLRWSGSRLDGDQALGGFEVIDLRVRYVMDAAWSAYGRAENLFNRRYQTVFGYNQAPRALFVGLQWQPKL